MHDGVITAIVLAEFMNLGMAIMATGNAVIRTGFFDLFVLQPAESQSLFFHAGLEKSAAAATTVVVGPVGDHIDKIFFADD
jgi:hypothetical protein